MHLVRRRFGRFLWDSVEIAQSCRRTKYTEHASKKIRPSKRLELYIFLMVLKPPVSLHGIALVYRTMIFISGAPPLSHCPPRMALSRLICPERQGRELKGGIALQATSPNGIALYRGIAVLHFADILGPFQLSTCRSQSPVSLGESHRPLTPILLKNIAIHLPFPSRYFCKSMPSSWQKVVYTPSICITIRLPFVSRCF